MNGTGCWHPVSPDTDSGQVEREAEAVPLVQAVSPGARKKRESREQPEVQ